MTQQHRTPVSNSALVSTLFCARAAREPLRSGKGGRPSPGPHTTCHPSHWMQILPSESLEPGRRQRPARPHCAACSWSCSRSRGTGALGPPCPGTGSSQHCQSRSCTPPLQHQRQQKVSAAGPEALTALGSPRQSNSPAAPTPHTDRSTPRSWLEESSTGLPSCAEPRRPGCSLSLQCHSALSFPFSPPGRTNTTQTQNLWSIYAASFQLSASTQEAAWQGWLQPVSRAMASFPRRHRSGTAVLCAVLCTVLTAPFLPLVTAGLSH